MKPSTDQINTNYYHHKEALKNVKPIISTHRKELGPSKNNKKEIQNYDEKALVYKMFQSLQKQKGTLDNRPPEMFLKNKKNINQPKRNKYDKYQDQMHKLELKSINERISNCGSIHQRKKRTYDPITHPTYFMRKPDDDADKVSIQPFAQTVLRHNQVKTTTTLKRPSSAHPKSEQSITRLYSSKPCNREHASTFIQPPQPSFPEPTFKSIIDYLVTNRVYKQLELRILYERLILRYTEELIDPIWNKVMQEMEKDL